VVEDTLEFLGDTELDFAGLSWAWKWIGLVLLHFTASKLTRPAWGTKWNPPRGGDSGES